MRDPPLADELPEEIRFLEAPRESLRGVTGFELPRREYDRDAYHARYKTVHAVIVPGEGEIRIPYIRRFEAGEFREFMNRLVRALDCRRVRFVNIYTEDHDALERARPDDAGLIRDAVHGFELEYEDWDHDDQPAACLVGEWNPDR